MLEMRREVVNKSQNGTTAISATKKKTLLGNCIYFGNNKTNNQILIPQYCLMEENEKISQIGIIYSIFGMEITQNIIDETTKSQCKHNSSFKVMINIVLPVSCCFASNSQWMSVVFCWEFCLFGPLMNLINLMCRYLWNFKIVMVMELVCDVRLWASTHHSAPHCQKMCRFVKPLLY